MKKAIGYALFLGFIIYLGFYIYGHSNDFKSLLDVPIQYLFFIAIAHIVIIFFNGLFIKFTIQPFGKDIGYEESFFVSVLTAAGNYFFPVGAGTGIKAVYLKKKFKLAYTDFMSTLSGNYILVFLINSLLGLIALFVLRNSASEAVVSTIGLVLGGIFVSMLILAFYGFPKTIISWLSKRKAVKRVADLIAQVLRGWNIITEHKTLMFKLISVTVGNFLITMIIVKLATAALGFSIGFWPLVLYTALGALSLLLNVTPGSIGIREAIFIFSSAVLGLTTPQIFSISIIQNGVLFFVLITAWILSRTTFIKNRIAS